LHSYTGNTAKYGVIDLSLIIHQRKLEQEIASWNRAFKVLEMDVGSVWSIEEIRIAKKTRMQALCIQIWTATALSPNQTAFDLFEAEFEQIINIAEMCMTEVRNSNFQVDWGIIPSLHFAGVQCRNPSHRRRILKILGSKKMERRLLSQLYHISAHPQGSDNQGK
jgi:hypothetical protein